jgi:hypothetical protein
MQHRLVISEIAQFPEHVTKRKREIPTPRGVLSRPKMREWGWPKEVELKCGREREEQQLPREQEWARVHRGIISWWILCTSRRADRSRRGRHRRTWSIRRSADTTRRCVLRCVFLLLLFWNDILMGQQQKWH